MGDAREGAQSSLVYVNNEKREAGDPANPRQQRRTGSKARPDRQKAAPALDARKTTPMEGGSQGMEMARKKTRMEEQGDRRKF